MKRKAKPETKPEPPAKVILLVFSLTTFEKVVRSLAAIKMCHGELLMEEVKAMHKIVMALAAGG